MEKILMDKHYNLTSKPNDGLKDEAPSWMNGLFETVKKPVRKESYNELFSHKQNVSKTCCKCGTKLSADEIDICKNCLKQ